MRRIGLLASENLGAQSPQSDAGTGFQAGARVGRPGLLLTCETITEARDKNDMRLNAPGDL
jgi:hypothetical protein